MKKTTAKPTDTTETDNPAKKNIDIIALKHLGIVTLEQRHSDSLDFHDCGVLSIKAALEASLKTGIEIGINLNQKGT